MSQEERRAELERLIALTELSIREASGLYSFWPDDFDPGHEHAISDPVDGIREWYMHGNCSMFAAILHERTGWPICGLHRTNAQPGLSGVAHRVCMMPDGLYADARGSSRTEDDVLADFSGVSQNTPLRILPSTLQDVVTRSRRPAVNYEAAREEHLDLLLPELGEMAMDEAAEPHPAFSM